MAYTRINKGKIMNKILSNWLEKNDCRCLTQDRSIRSNLEKWLVNGTLFIIEFYDRGGHTIWIETTKKNDIHASLKVLEKHCDIK